MPNVIPLTGSALPIATVLNMPNSAHTLDGWLPCNGAAINRAVYADLFAEMGTTFGDGDGVTTFNLPDFRGEFLRGWNGGGYGAANHQDNTTRAPRRTGHITSMEDGGVHFHGNAASGNETVNHSHKPGYLVNMRYFDAFGKAQSIQNIHRRLSAYDRAGVNSNARYKTDTKGAHVHNDYNTSGGGKHTHTWGQSAGGKGDAETRPRNVAMQFIIYTGVA